MSSTIEILRQLTAAGLTQTEIASCTGIPQPRLSRWAGGATPASADDALKLHALLLSLPPAPMEANDAN